MTTTTTTLNTSRKYAYHDVAELVKVLREKSLTRKQMLAIQTKYEPEANWTDLTFYNLVSYLGNHYPIYKTDKWKYKILTDADLEQYREELRIEHRKQRNDMEKNATKYY